MSESIQNSRNMSGRPVDQGHSIDSNMVSEIIVSPVSTGRTCRICYDGSSGEPLVTPCRCSGTVGLVHKTCLQKWLVSANQDKCDICKYQFEVRRKPRPINEWFTEPGHETDIHNFYGDLVSWLVLTPMAFLADYLCVTSSLMYMQEQSFLEAYTLLVISSLLTLVYITWMILSIRYHLRVIRRFRGRATVIELVSVKRRTPPKKQTPVIPPDIVIRRCTPVITVAEIQVNADQVGSPLLRPSSPNQTVSNMAGSQTV